MTFLIGFVLLLALTYCTRRDEQQEAEQYYVQYDAETDRGNSEPENKAYSSGRRQRVWTRSRRSCCDASDEGEM